MGDQRRPGQQVDDPPSRQISGPVTPLQERFARGHAHLANRAALNVALRVDLAGRLDYVALSNALSGLVSRHDALRTRFREQEGRFIQEVLSSLPVKLVVDDLGAVPGHQVEQTVAKWCDLQARASLDPARGDVTRFSLMMVDDDNAVLMMVQHHIVTDAASQGILLSDLAKLYSAEVQEGNSGPSPSPVQLLDYVRWQESYLSGDAGDRLRNYWLRELADAPLSMSLPGDSPRPDTLSGNGTFQPFDLPHRLSRQIEDWARARRVSVYAVLITAFGHLLCGLVDQREVVVIGAFPGRTRQEFETTVGPLTNSLAIRLPQLPNVSVEEAVDRTASRLWAGVDHVDLPFPLVLDLLNEESGRGEERFPQVWFSMHPAPDRCVDAPNLKMRARGIAIPGARSDLGVLVMHKDGKIRFWVETADHVASATVRRWMTEYEELLHRAVSDLSTPMRVW